LKLDAARLDVLVWTLVYGGLLVVGVGVALGRNRAGYGWGVAGGGALLVAAGVVLIWLRSRLRDVEP
jgi:hypothetical protein